MKSSTKVLKNYVSLFSALVVVSSGCGTWLGNPKQPTDDEPAQSKSEVSIELQGAASTSQLSLAPRSIRVLSKSGSSVGTIALDTAYVVLGKIKLKTISASPETEFKGPIVVDLIANTASPEIEPIKISDAEFEDIELSIAKYSAEKLGRSESDPLSNYSIYLGGVYTNASGANVNFKVRMDLDENVSLAAFAAKNKKIPLTKDALNKLIVAFDLNAWFDFSNSKNNESGYDLASLPAGDIDIDKETEGVGQKIKEVIKKNINSSARFGRDKDGNGKLEKAEDNHDEGETE